MDIILWYLDKNKGKHQYNYKWGSTYKGTNKFIANFYSAVKYLNDKGVGNMVKALATQNERFSIVEATGNTESKSNGTKSMLWNPTLGLKTDKGVVLSPSSVLNHEIDHAVDELKNPTLHLRNTIAYDKQFTTKEERRVVTGSEQTTAVALGEIQPGQLTRGNHEGDNFPTDGPTTIQPAKKTD